MIKNKLLKNHKKYIIISVLLLLGVIIGSIYGSRNAITDADYFSAFISAYKLHGVSSYDIFTRTVLLNLRTVSFVWISGWFLFLVPLNFIEITAKGFGLGYTISYLISVNGFKGLLFSFSALFVQNIIFIPALILLSVYELNFAITFSSKKMCIRQRRKMIANNLLIFIFVIVLALVLSLIDAYVVPVFVKILCNSML